MSTIAQTTYGYTELGYTRPEAIHRICHDRLSRSNSRGHGNRAKRRQVWLEMQRETAAWFDHFCQLGPEDVDAMAERDNRKHWMVNYHDL